jgi:hypothetical protein
MTEQATNQPTMRDRLGERHHDEYVDALIKAQSQIATAMAETNTVKARRALEEAAANVGIAERRLKAALTGFSR